MKDLTLQTKDKRQRCYRISSQTFQELLKSLTERDIPPLSIKINLLRSVLNYYMTQQLKSLLHQISLTQHKPRETVLCQ